MLQRIRSISLIVTIGSFLVLGLSIFISEAFGLSFLPSWPWIYGLLVALTQILFVGIFLGIGALIGVSVDIWSEEKYLSAGKSSKSIWWLAGGIFGTLGGIQILLSIMQ